MKECPLYTLWKLGILGIQHSEGMAFVHAVDIAHIGYTAQRRSGLCRGRGQWGYGVYCTVKECPSKRLSHIRHMEYITMWRSVLRRGCGTLGIWSLLHCEEMSFVEAVAHWVFGVYCTVKKCPSQRLWHIGHMEFTAL